MKIKMQKLFFFGIAVLFSFATLAQDFLEVPNSNPALHSEGSKFKLKERKNAYLLDSVVYQFSTQSLPFIDDFTSDNFPTLVTDPLSDPRVKDSLFYALRELNNDIYRGIALDTTPTFVYTIDSVSTGYDTISTTPNQGINLFAFELSSYPVEFELVTLYPPYNVTDTLSGGTDTTFISPLYVQDSIRYYIVEVDSNAFYADRFVHLNNALGFYPPSIGVVSFDGLDERGLPYDFETLVSSGQADYLTSNPIDLSGTSDSTYFSFYYQAKGFALDGPDTEDSLSLEFYNDSTKRWGLVWQTEGIAPNQSPDSFRQVILRVEPKFRRSGFQFRFRNRARLNGAFDHWNLDYIYLDDNRSFRDTAQKDLAYVYPASSFLKDYTAMPIWHFRSNPDQYIADSVLLVVRNNHDEPLNVFNKIQVKDPLNPPPNYLYTFPGLNFFRGIDALGNLNLGYPLNFNYPIPNTDTFRVIQEACDVDFRPAPIEEKDFIKANDTVYSTAILNRYYAYDDGSAEASYGIDAGSQGANKTYIAVRFDMPFQDTIGGVQMYFLPQENDIRNQRFKLTVWSGLNPPNVIFQKEVDDRAIFGERDGFITYWFDSLVIAGPTFYVGFEKTGPRSMALGYDFNRNNRDKISWSLDGFNWFFPSNNIFDGSLMIRPILRKKEFGVGIAESPKQPSAQKLKVFPNPVEHEFYIPELPKGLDRLQLYTTDGRLVREYDPRQYAYSVDGLGDGIFILRAQSNQGGVWTAKIMVHQR
jgi:hypothetical protein